MSESARPLDVEHKCFGCGKQIGSHEPHIHFGMDEWLAYTGERDEGFGLDDLLHFAYCADCCKPGSLAHLEAHEI